MAFNNFSGIGKAGTGTLKVDGKVVDTKRMEKTIPIILQWDESFDIGSDTITGINDADYTPPFPLTAKFNKLTIKIDRPQLSPEDIKKLEGAMLAAERRTSGSRISTLVQKIEARVDKRRRLPQAGRRKEAWPHRAHRFRAGMHEVMNGATIWRRDSKSPPQPASCRPRWRVIVSEQWVCRHEKTEVGFFDAGLDRNFCNAVQCPAVQVRKRRCRRASPRLTRSRPGSARCVSSTKSRIRPAPKKSTTIWITSAQFRPISLLKSTNCSTKALR